MSNGSVKTGAVYELQKNEVIDKFHLGMLENNRIKGLLDYNSRVVSGNFEFSFHPKGICVEYIFENPIKRDDFIKVFLAILNVIKDCKEYMLSPGNFLLEPSFIFVNQTLDEAYLAFLPIVESENRILSKQIIRLLNEVTPNRSEDTLYWSDLLLFLKEDPQVTVEGIIEFIEKLNLRPENSAVKFRRNESAGEPAAPQPQSAPAAPSRPVNVQPVVNNVVVPKQVPSQKPILFAEKKEQVPKETAKKAKLPFFSGSKGEAKKKKPNLFMSTPERNVVNTPVVNQGVQNGFNFEQNGETVQINTGDETVMLSDFNYEAKTSNGVYIERESKKLFLRDGLNTIGSGKMTPDGSVCDIVVENIGGKVHRMHASIIKNGSECRVLSAPTAKNGTYLNGNRLVPNEHYKLSNGDKIKFSESEYTFVCEINAD